MTNNTFQKITLKPTLAPAGAVSSPDTGSPSAGVFVGESCRTCKWAYLRVEKTKDWNYETILKKERNHEPIPYKARRLQ